MQGQDCSIYSPPASKRNLANVQACCIDELLSRLADDTTMSQCIHKVGLVVGEPNLEVTFGPTRSKINAWKQKRAEARSQQNSSTCMRMPDCWKD